MILTQLFYVHPGQEAVFEAFEATVVPLIVSASIEVPYEVHLLRFPNDAALAAYTADPVRQAALPLRTASVLAVRVVIGHTDGEWLPLSS